MNEAQNKSKEKKETNHMGVLSYTYRNGGKETKEHFYDDALQRAFYEMCVLA